MNSTLEPIYSPCSSKLNLKTPSLEFQTKFTLKPPKVNRSNLFEHRPQNTLLILNEFSTIWMPRWYMYTKSELKLSTNYHLISCTSSSERFKRRSLTSSIVCSTLWFLPRAIRITKRYLLANSKKLWKARSRFLTRKPKRSTSCWE